MGELICVPDEELKKRMLHLGILTFGVYALAMWWFVYRKLPSVVDEEGITLRDERRFRWSDMSTFVVKDDLAIKFGDEMVSILPSDLANGAEVMKFAKKQLALVRRGRKKPAKNLEEDDDEVAAPTSKKVGPNLHFLTTFTHGMTRPDIGSRLGSDKGLEYDAESNTLSQATELVPPFDRVKYAFDGDALKSVQLELAHRGNWVDFETVARDAMFTIVGTTTFKEADGKPFDLDRTQDRLEAASEKRAVGVLFSGRHPKGKLIGEIRARAHGRSQIFRFTLTWEPNKPKPSESPPQSTQDGIEAG